MSFLPDFETDYKELHDLLNQAVQGHILMSALELKVFDQLARPQSAGQLATVIGVPEQRCQVFLDTLTACGYARKQGETYQNTLLSQRFLTNASPAYIGDLLLESWKMLALPPESLAQWLKEGFPPSPDNELDREELWGKMAHANAQYARTGLAQLAVEQISSLPGFTAMGKMLDLGGGPGLVAMALAEANPNLEAVVLDQPAVAEVAREYIDKYGFSGRVRALGADYARDDIGQGYDLVWASATLNFYRDSLPIIFEKIYQAMNPGGVFACLQDGLTHQGTQPKDMVLSCFMAVLRGSMKNFHQGEIAQAMVEVGFTPVRSRTLDTSFGPMDLDLAVKPS
ncbi:hypothetical protein AAU61_05700 [Desulfocarbo indianensis]|nr:hypothetical protein AAU61_05700 [Desulfocarbo indianensis]